MRSALLAAVESGTWVWALGWDFFVALGAVGFAFFAWRLASKTRDATAEDEADRRARWRPILLPIAQSPGCTYGAASDL
ncbi:hypothetical protein AB0O74_00710 [Streptomyces rubiginosohelvolus]|uniref:hypothetical protein n=1 Tax=Streptomyces rubiginosohelvolus TaxID=67362 RepID=UPI0034371E6E